MTQFPIRTQQDFWNEYWNASHPDWGLHEVHSRQARDVVSWLERLGRDDLDILDVGCGAGWLEAQLLRFGRVTATDLADEPLQRAAERTPDARFIAGDVMTLELEPEGFDVIVSLEVLAHVDDQRAFVSRIASLLRSGGSLMLATQNRPVLERCKHITPVGEGQNRRWTDAEELRALVEPDFHIVDLYTATPVSDHGFMRVVNSQKVNWPVRQLFGDRIDRLKERRGWGWTLMCLAQRR
jgi:SAM-dependent methyltransferase